MDNSKEKKITPIEFERNAFVEWDPAPGKTLRGQFLHRVRDTKDGIMKSVVLCSNGTYLVLPEALRHLSNTDIKYVEKQGVKPGPIHVWENQKKKVDST